MYVATIQKTKYVRSILRGDYIPSFWNSQYSCLSPRFSFVYRDIIKKLNFMFNSEDELDGFDDMYGDTESCFFGWLISNGALGIDWAFYENWSESLLSQYTVVVIDIPESSLVLSDFTKLCDYLYGDSHDLSESYVNGYFVDGRYVQACWKSGHALDVIGMFSIKDFRKRFG